MKHLIISLILLASDAACGKSPKYRPGNKPANAPTETPEGMQDPAAPSASTMLTCGMKTGKTYTGFGNANLVAGRVTEIPKDGDRFQIKPYSVLSGEFNRMIGSAPASLAANAASFGVAPARWYAKTDASAVTLFTSYRVAYEAALGIAAADAKYAAAPTEESATANCTAFARQAWNRLPGPEEVNACKKIALVETAQETDIKTRWAYALASVMTAAGFLAY